MKILWLSEHEPLESQAKELQTLFGDDIQICEDYDRFRNAKEVKRRFEEGGYDDLVVVAPFTVIKRLCELELYPLYAEVIQLPHPDMAEFQCRGRDYKFLGFKRVKAVEMVFFDCIVPLAEVGMTDCEFCESKVKEPEDINTSLECPNCHAIYWLESEDDMHDVHHDASEHFKVEEWQVEVKTRKDFITFDEGDNWHLVFARPKTIETNTETGEED